MIKYLLVALAFFIATPSAFALGTFTPTTVYYDTVVTFDVDPNYFAYFYPDGTELTQTDGTNTSYAWNVLLLSPSSPFGVYHFLEVDPLVSDCAGLTYTQCLGGASYVGNDIAVTYLAPATADALATMLSNASSSMEMTTGFNVQGVVHWAGENLIKLFIGSGLAVLLALRGWLVALLIIGSVVYLAYRAFRFFRH